MRWLRGVTPGPYSTSRNTVPAGSTVPTLRSPSSVSPPLSAGNAPVVQITQLSWFGRREIVFFEISSIATTALPLAS